MSTTFLVPANNASSTLASSIGAGDTSLSLTAGGGSLFPSTYPYHITIFELSSGQMINMEILSCTSRAGDVLTVTRGAESTTGISHNGGAYVSIFVTAQALSDLNAVGTLSGSTLPASGAAVGQQFLHTPTGREILYQWDGSTWQPIQSYGTMTLYVAPTGTDDLNHGYGTGTAAFHTIGYAYAMIPQTLGGTVTVNTAAGTYAENLHWVSKNSDYHINFVGAMTTLASLTATGGTKGTQGSSTCAQVNGTFTANQYDNKLIQFTSGTNNGIIAVVGLTTTSKLYLVGKVLNAQPQNNDTYAILGWGTVLQGYIEVQGGLTIGYNSDNNECRVNFTQFKIYSSTGGSEESAMIYTIGGAIQLQDCWIVNDGATVTVNADTNSYQNFRNCVFTWLVTPGANVSQIISAWHGFIDLMYCRIVGPTTSGTTCGLMACQHGVLIISQCELLGWTWGLQAQNMSYGGMECMTDGTLSFIHGNASGVGAGDLSLIRTNLAAQYGTKLDGTADTNTTQNYQAYGTYAIIKNDA